MHSERAKNRFAASWSGGRAYFQTFDLQEDAFSNTGAYSRFILILISYILFLTRPFVRSSVRSSAKIACFVIGLKSRELASRANTKVICEKMTKNIVFFRESA